ncbi:MAG: DNA polymerase [Caldisphaera sp.]
MEFGVFDIEALDWNKVYAIGFFDGKELKILAEKGKPNNYFISWLFDNLPSKKVFYAHNGGRYDFLFIFDWLQENKIKPYGLRLVHGSVAEFRVKYKDKVLIFRDSYLILPNSLKKLTVDFNVEHKKLEMDYDIGIDDERFNDYFKNDILGLYEVIQKSGLYSHLTIASNSISVFRDEYYGKKFSANEYRVEEFFRKAYHGGRTEIFRLYGENLKYYDVNSLYPFVMHKYKYPIPEANNFKIIKEPSQEITNEGLYFAKVSIDNLLIPVLPVKESKLIFPIGTFTGWFYGSELLLARRMGYLINIKKAIEFKTDYIFKDYISYYYNIKKTHTGSQKAIAKLMLNSLYGKFGQKRERENYELSDFIEGHLSNSVSLKIHKYVDIDSTFIHPEIAGMITANARAELYSLFLKAGLKNIYYCDTDSILTDVSLPTSNELGDIKLEDEIKEYISLLPKVYAYKRYNGDIVIKAKGLDSEKLSYNDFFYSLKSGDLSNFKDERERINTFKEHFRRLGSIDYTSKIKLIKKLNKGYDKRIINNDFTTSPLFIKSLDKKNI